MPVAGAAIVGGAMLGSAVIGSRSASKAAGATERAADLQAAVAREQLDLGREQWAWNKEQYEKHVEPTLDRVTEMQLGSMEENRARATSQWDQYQSIFAPAEKKMAEFAMGYDTPERRAERRAMAAADVAGAYDRSDEMLGRNLSRLGLNRGRDAMLQTSLARARDTAGAMTKSDRDTELTGAALVEGVSKFGRGLPSTGVAADTVAIQGGNAAAGNTIAGLNARNAGMNAALPWYSSAMTGNARSADLMGNAYSIRQQNLGDIGQGLGMAFGGSRPWWMTPTTTGGGGAIQPAYDYSFDGLNKGGLVRKKKRKYGTHYRIVQKGYNKGGLVEKPVMTESVTIVLDNTQALDPTGHMTEGYRNGGLVRRSKKKRMPGAQFYADGGMVRGPGTETSDSIPAVIDGQQPTRLSDGEAVLNAGAVEIVGEEFIERVNQAGLQRQGRTPEMIEGEATEVEE